MVETLILQVLPGLRQLVDGMEPRELEAVPEPEALSQAADSLGSVHSEFWAALGVFFGVAAVIQVSMAAAIAGREWRRSRRWRGLSRYLKTGDGREAAEKELGQIQLIVELTAHQEEHVGMEWRLLTATERSIARGIASGKTAQEIAQELACTPSHVYNLRSNIRRKWGVDSNQALQRAIQERLSEDV